MTASLHQNVQYNCVQTVSHFSNERLEKGEPAKEVSLEIKLLGGERNLRERILLVCVCTPEDL